jgi:hypothetical protein
MLYTNPKYDKSDDILTQLGYKPAAKGGTGTGTKSGGTTGTSGSGTEQGKPDAGSGKDAPPKTEDRPK